MVGWETGMASEHFMHAKCAIGFFTTPTCFHFFLTPLAFGKAPSACILLGTGPAVLGEASSPHQQLITRVQALRLLPRQTSGQSPYRTCTRTACSWARRNRRYFTTTTTPSALSCIPYRCWARCAAPARMSSSRRRCYIISARRRR